MYPERSQAEFDLFVSYAQADNRDEHDGKVAVLVHAIETEHERFAGAAPRSSSTPATSARWTTGSTGSSPACGTRR